MTLLDILRRERTNFAFLSGEYARQAATTYNTWNAGGRKDDDLLANFFEFFYKSEELKDRVKWIDAVIDEWIKTI